MTKKIAFGSIVAAALCVAVLGAQKTASYLQATQDVIAGAVDSGSPMALESARIEGLIRQAEADAISLEGRVADVESQRNATSKAVEQARNAVNSERTLLTKIKDLLDEKRNVYSVGLREYSYAEVNSDALQRVDELKRLEEEVAFRETLVRDLDRALVQGQGNVAEMRKRVRTLRDAKARLEARNANADVRLEVAKLVNAITPSQVASGSELESAFRNYERRVGEKERIATVRLLGSPTPGRIDYSATIVAQDATAAIAQALARNTKAKKE